MKTNMKVDFWSVIETAMWIMAALWGVLWIVGFWNMAMDGMTESYQWFALTVGAALAIRAFRGESH